MKKYSEEGAKLVKYDKEILKKKGYIGANLINPRAYKGSKADVFLQRTLIRHHPEKIAEIIMSLLK